MEVSSICLCKKTFLHCFATWHTVEVVVERCQISELRNMKIGRREILMWRFSTKWRKWKMTSRKVTATEWIVNENKLSQAPLVAWHVLSSIWVHFGPWGLIFLVKNWFSHIFPAPAWSPYQSLFLRYEIEKGLRAVYLNPDVRLRWWASRNRLFNSCLVSALMIDCLVNLVNLCNTFNI